MTEHDELIRDPWLQPANGSVATPTVDAPPPFGGRSLPSRQAWRETSPDELAGPRDSQLLPPPSAPPSGVAPTAPTRLGFDTPDEGISTGFAPLPPSQRSTMNPLAVVSLILGLVGFLLVTPLFAIVTGTAALLQIRRSATQKGRTVALGGIVLGALWIPFIAVTITAGLGTQINEADLPTREEFVDVAASSSETETMFGIDLMPESTAAEARLLLREGMGCAYDVLSQEPRYLMAVYQDPTPDAGWHRIRGLSQERATEIDAQAEACWTEIDRDFAGLFGN